MKKTLSLLAIVLATAATSFAGQAVSSKKVVVPTEDCRFRANEWQVDLATVGIVGTYGSDSKQALGGGLGINYFWSKFFGVGVDNSVLGMHNAGQTSTTGLQGLYSVQADLLLRYPICSWNLAPYAMIGGGALWGGVLNQGDGNIGGGLEYRVTNNLGLFADCRWLYGSNTSKTLSMAMPRVGLRLAF